MLALCNFFAQPVCCADSLRLRRRKTSKAQPRAKYRVSCENVSKTTTGKVRLTIVCKDIGVKKVQISKCKEKLLKVCDTSEVHGNYSFLLLIK